MVKQILLQLAFAFCTKFPNCLPTGWYQPQLKSFTRVLKSEQGVTLDRDFLRLTRIYKIEKGYKSVKV